MDATSLFPSLKADKSAAIIVEEVVNSDVIFENIDIRHSGTRCIFEKEFTSKIH